MRGLYLAAAIFLGGPALAQELAAPKLTLSVTQEQAMLIVQTLGAIGCGTVTQLMVCQQAKAQMK